jgi:ribosomal protein L11 methyltransferase
MRSLSEKPNHKTKENSRVQTVQQTVLETLRNADTRLTLLDIERQLSRYCRDDRRAVRSAIKELVNQRELMYVSDVGHTFIETSIYKPIRITETIVLKPWDCTLEPGAGDIVVSLCHGSSFGSGQHPTTRLCLEGLEYLLRKEFVAWLGKKSRVLDLGTGSGVLIITAVKMGLASGVGLDVDPCAVSEARGNVAYNGLSERITISSEPFEAFEEAFNLIMANLRLPTLTSFLPQMVYRTTPGGRILLSGIKSEERDSFIKQGHGLGLNREWVGEEHGWAAIVFYKENLKKACVV